MHFQSAAKPAPKAESADGLSNKPASQFNVNVKTGMSEHLTLTTQSNETGRAQTALLPYRKESNRYVVAATTSKRGSKPIWFLNLKKEPMVQLEIEGVQFYAQARTPTGRERIDLLKIARDLAPNMTNKIPRDTCLVLLTPMW